MHDHRDTMLNKTALILNCEHIAHSGLLHWSRHMRVSNTIPERRWSVNGSDRLTAITGSALEELASIWWRIWIPAPRRYGAR